MQFPSQNSRFLCNRPDAPQYLEASELQLSERQIYTVRTLGQATPSSTQSWISDDTIWEGSARRLDDMATCPDTTQYSRIFQARSPLRMQKGVTVKTVQTRSYLGKICASLEKWSLKTVRTQLSDCPDAAQRTPILS
jgi:hypothetical protein